MYVVYEMQSQSTCRHTCEPITYCHQYWNQSRRRPPPNSPTGCPRGGKWTPSWGERALYVGVTEGSHRKVLGRGPHTDKHVGEWLKRSSENLREIPALRRGLLILARHWLEQHSHIHIYQHFPWRTKSTILKPNIDFVSWGFLLLGYHYSTRLKSVKNLRG